MGKVFTKKFEKSNSLFHPTTFVHCCVYFVAKIYDHSCLFGEIFIFANACTTVSTCLRSTHMSSCSVMESDTILGDDQSHRSCCEYLTLNIILTLNSGEKPISLIMVGILEIMNNMHTWLLMSVLHVITSIPVYHTPTSGTVPVGKSSQCVTG